MRRTIRGEWDSSESMDEFCARTHELVKEKWGSPEPAFRTILCFETQDFMIEEVLDDECQSTKSVLDVKPG